MGASSCQRSRAPPGGIPLSGMHGHCLVRSSAEEGELIYTEQITVDQHTQVPAEARTWDGAPCCPGTDIISPARQAQGPTFMRPQASCWMLTLRRSRYTTCMIHPQQVGASKHLPYNQARSHFYSFHADKKLE